MRTFFKKYREVIILYFFFVGVYLSFLSRHYDYDSLSLARWAEEGLFFVRYQQFHLLNYTINTLLFNLFKFLGYKEGAILPLQILDGVAGACGLVVFYLLIYRLFKRKFISLVTTLGLGFSSEYWHYSTEVETHILSIFFLLLSLYFILKDSPYYKKSGIFVSMIFFALAVFSSTAYIIFLPFFLLVIFTSLNPLSEKKVSAKSLIKYVLLFWLIPYCLIGFIVQWNYFFPYFLEGKYLKFFKKIGLYMFFWFRSHEKFSPIQFDDIYFIAQNITRMLFGFTSNPILGLGLFFFSIAFLVLNYRLLERKSKRVGFCCVVMCFIFLSVFFIYEPFNTQRYTPLLIFFWILIALCMSVSDIVFPGKILKVLEFLIVIGAGILNFSFRVFPYSKAENNCYLTKALYLKKIVKDRDLLVIVGKNELGYPEPMVSYISYFLGVDFLELGFLDWRFYNKFKRTPLNKKELFSFLNDSITLRLKQGKKVYLLGECFLLKPKQRPKLTINVASFEEIVNFLKSNYNLVKIYTFNQKTCKGEDLYRIEALRALR